MAPTPDNSLRRRVQQLEKQLARFERSQAVRREARRVRRRDVFLAETRAFEGESYPASGNVLPFRLVDAHFTAAEGDQQIEQQERSQHGRLWARTLDGQYYGEETLMRLERLRGLGGAGAGEWFAQPFSATRVGHFNRAGGFDDGQQLTSGSTTSPNTLELNNSPGSFDSIYSLDTSTHRVTASATGYYRVTGVSDFQFFGSAGDGARTHLQLGGSGFANLLGFTRTFGQLVIPANPPNLSENRHTLSFCGVIYLAEGGYLELQASRAITHQDAGTEEVFAYLCSLSIESYSFAAFE